MPFGVERCYCSRCYPIELSAKSPWILQCSRCGEEVRLGWRAIRGVQTKDWWHRGDVDHHTVLGHTMTIAQWEENERQLDLPRTRMAMINGVETEVVYTARNWKQTKATKGENDGAENDGETEAWDGVVPEPEVRADHTVVPWPLRQSVPNGVWLVLKPALDAGLEVARCTFARGPWLRADGQRPPVQDTWVATVRVPGVDSGTFAAVGCWRRANEDWKFEHGLLITDRHGEPASAAAIKSWIKSVTPPKIKKPRRPKNA